MFTVTLNTDNAAFDEPHGEIARILRELADRIEAGKFTRSLHDINGNAVGRVERIARSTEA
jgi:hypothetical protein